MIKQSIDSASLKKRNEEN